MLLKRASLQRDLQARLTTLEKTTLGDISELAALKSKLEKGE